MGIFNLTMREVSIDKPNFLGKEQKVVAFVDFRLQNEHISKGGRVIEYSVIKCYPNMKIEVFHTIAKPCTSLIKPRIKYGHETYMERLGITNEAVSESRDTYEVFRDFYEFISNVDILIFYDYKWHMNILKYYLIELDLDIPKLWLWDIKNLVDKEGYSDYFLSEWNGYLRCYKTLLMFDAYHGVKLKERKYKEGLSSTYWCSTMNRGKLIDRFNARLKKHLKWLRTGRIKDTSKCGLSLKKWLSEHGGISPIMRKRLERDSNVSERE